MIGSHLLDALLQKGYRVTGMDNFSFGKEVNIEHNFSNPSFTFIKGDVTDPDLVKKLAKNIDTIIHLAAFKKIGEKDFSMPTFQINGKGTENVFEAARESGCKVLFASTSDVYGMSPDLPLKEDGDLLIGPSMIKRWSYAVSKLYGEQMAFAYYKDHGVPVVVIRYFGGFSPRSSFAWSGGHVPIFIRAVLKDEEIIIHGDGTQTRSMGFVHDLVKGTVLALESNKAIGEIINIGNDEELSVVDTAHLIYEIAATGKERRIKFIPMSEVFGKYKDIMRRIPDLSKAKELLGYEPSVTLRAAIEQTIKEIKSAGA